MTENEAIRAVSDAIDARCAANPTWPVLPDGVRPQDFTEVWSGAMEHDPVTGETQAWFTPRTGPVEVTYATDRPRRLADALAQFDNAVPDAEAERERIASGWPWGAWWLFVRAGVHHEDRDAVRDRYETALGWARSRGTTRDVRTLETFTDAVTEAYNGFPDDWPKLTDRR